MKSSSLDTLVKSAIDISHDRNELWKNILSGLECHNLCEIGVWKAEFSAYLLRNLNQIQKYTLVDPWEHLSNWSKPSNRSDDEFNEIYSEAMERISSYSDRVTVIRKTTKEAAPRIPSVS